MKFLIYFVMFFLLFNGFTANQVANSLIQKSCKKNVDFAREPHNYEEFCVASLRENPESQKVRNIDELIVVGMNNAISNLTNVKGIMEKIIKERKYKSTLSKTLLENCIKHYSEGYQSLTSSLKYLKVRDFNKALDVMRDASTTMVTCDLAFNGDNQQIFPVKKENDVLFVMIDIPYFFNYNAHHRSKG